MMKPRLARGTVDLAGAGDGGWTVVLFVAAKIMTALHAYLAHYDLVVVTGGSSGIGEAFIRGLQARRPTLAFCNVSRRAPTLASKGLNLVHVPCDLARRDEVASAAASVIRWAERAEAAPGRMLLINNSGFGAYGRFPEPALERQLELIDVNIRALVELTGRLLPVLRARGGAIVNVASTAAFQPTPFLATYGASKAFVLHWSLALHEELRGTGVGTLALCPGPTRTGFFRRAGVEAGGADDRLSMTREAVVEAALRALAAGRRQVVPGWKNKLSTWVAARGPKPWVARVAGLALARMRLPANQR